MKANTLTSPTPVLSSTSPSRFNGCTPVEPLTEPLQIEQQQQQQATSSPDDSVVEASPHPQDIERAAYELYAEGGYEEGHSVEHWLEAESRLRQAPLAKVA